MDNQKIKKNKREKQRLKRQYIRKNKKIMKKNILYCPKDIVKYIFNMIPVSNYKFPPLGNGLNKYDLVKVKYNNIFHNGIIIDQLRINKYKIKFIDGLDYVLINKIIKLKKNNKKINYINLNYKYL